MTHPTGPDRATSLLDRIVALGDSPQDSEEQTSAQHFLVYMGLLMSCGGLIWGFISLAYDLYAPAIIPLGYVVLTSINFSYFRFTKNFEVSRFVQVLLSMLLPFLFQWSLGGFVPSGAVMLWALIALAGSLTFQDARLGARWLAAFLILTVFSGLIDAPLQRQAIEVAAQATTLFFVLNISVITTIVFVLIAYLLAKRDEARAKVAEMSSILKQMFGRYLSTEVMNSLIENPSGLELGGKRSQVTIMMTDLRGFTALSERLEPEQVVQLLNSYFEIMVDLVLKHNGTINEFIGDSLLVIFGAPHPMEDRAERAVACAIEMQNAMVEVNERNRANGLPELGMGIGLNEAEVVVGNIGSSKRSKYAVVGNGVNMTSRIESYTVGGQILASHSVVDQVGDILSIDSQRDVRPKGAEATFRVFGVAGISGRFNLSLLQGAQAPTDLEQRVSVWYSLIEGKDVAESERRGTILRLSRRGAEVDLAEPIDVWTNIQLSLGEVDDQLSARVFYSKVLEKTSTAEHTYWVSFTSMPSDVSAYLQACIQYACATPANSSTGGDLGPQK